MAKKVAAWVSNNGKHFETEEAADFEDCSSFIAEEFVGVFNGSWPQDTKARWISGNIEKLNELAELINRHKKTRKS